MTLSAESHGSFSTSAHVLSSGVRVLKSLVNHPLALVELPMDGHVDTLSTLAGVIDVEENHPVSAHAFVPKPPSQEKQNKNKEETQWIILFCRLYVQNVGDLWHLDNVCKPDFSSEDGKYTYNFLGTGVDVYVLDTGINAAHVDFGGRAVRFASYSGSYCDDCNGHGERFLMKISKKMEGELGFAHSLFFFFSRFLFPRHARCWDCGG